MNDVSFDVSFDVVRRQAEPLVIGNDIFCSFYDWELSQKDLEKARLELGETEEKKAMCIRELKSKLANDVEINYRQDDAYLLRFLRTRKYNVLKAYENMNQAYHSKEKYKDFFSTSPEAVSLQKLNWFTILPYTDEEGRVLILLKFRRWNPHEIPHEKMAQTFTNVMDIAVLNPKCQINGMVGIFDMSGFTLKHALELLKRDRLRAFAASVQNGYPYRMKNCFCINVNRYFRYTYSFLKTFLRKKISDRIILLGYDISDLHRHVNPALLPISLKGSLKDEDCNFSEFVIDNYPYLRYERSFAWIH